MQDPSPMARRHRRRDRPAAGERGDTDETDSTTAETARPPAQAARRHRPDRGLRDLVGGGPSQLGVSGALRGRDVDRPTEQELAEAERELVIVRRNWTPGSP